MRTVGATIVLDSDLHVSRSIFGVLAGRGARPLRESGTMAGIG
jgi:hypothetical protein